MRYPITRMAALGAACLLFCALIGGCDSGGCGHNSPLTAPPPVVDKTPHIFVTDRTNNRLVQMDTFQGANWTTLLGERGLAFSEPSKVRVDSRGHIYVADTGNGRIVRMDDMNGSGAVAFGTPGNGVNQFNTVDDVFVDAQNRIYAVDNNNNRVVRMDDMNGTNWTTYGTKGTGTGQFNAPVSVFVDSTGRIYVNDFFNERIVRMNDMSGIGWTTFSTKNWSVKDIFVDAGNRIYIVSGNKNSLIRMDDMNGGGLVQYNYPHTFPRSVAVDSQGHIYMGGNNWVTRIDDIHGTGPVSLNASGTGHSLFVSVSGICLDAMGRIYVADDNAQHVARFDDMTGQNWVAISKPYAQPFTAPGGVSAFLNSAGNSIFLSDTNNHRILQTTIDGNTQTVLGTQGSGKGQFNAPTGICAAATGLYVADTGNHRIVQASLNTLIWNTLGSQGSGTNQFNSPTGVFVDAQNHIYVADTGNNRIVQFNDITGAGWKALGGSADGTQTFSAPQGICLDHAGRIYVADTGNNRIVRVDDMAGNGWKTLGTLGAGANQFNHPTSIIRDTSGMTYITDAGNNRLVRIGDIDTGTWATLGTAGSGVDQFQQPFGVAVSTPELGPATGGGGTGGAPDFTVTVNPTSANVSQGASVNLSVAVTGQQGFTGQVALAVSGLPSGVSGAFQQSSVQAGGTATLALTAGSSAPVTSAPATVTVTGTSGSLKQAATFALSVMAAAQSGGKIVFSSAVSTALGKAAIVVMNADGSGRMQLTDGTNLDADPRFSPDGKSIVFSRNDMEIWLVHTDGSGLTKIMPSGLIGTEMNTSPFFSADGTQILFVSVSHTVLASMNLDGSSARYLTKPLLEIDQASVSPDGKTIVFAGRISASEETNDLYLMNPDGTNLRKLPNPSGRDVEGPRFSRDGSQLVFYSRAVTGNYAQLSDIYTMSTAGTNPQKLTSDTESGWPVFTSAGRIVFSTWRDGPTEIYVMDASGANATRLTQSAAGTSNESPDSQ